MKLLFTSPLIMYRLAFILFVALLSLANSVQAEDVRYYDIETIIFESLDPAARASENWKSDINRQIPAVAAELDQPYPGPIPPQYNPSLTFKSLPASEYQLNDAAKLLANSHQYRILLHTAWVQPGMGPDAALPVHIHQSFLAETPVSHSLAPADASAPADNLPSATSETQTRSVLDGYIKIILTRYLHADVDLVYTTGLPVNPQTPGAAATSSPTNTSGMNTGTAVAGTTITPDTVTNDSSGIDSDSTTALPPPVIYRLHQSRRMRSNVLHYLDHPVLGMLLIITQHKTK